MEQKFEQIELNNLKIEEGEKIFLDDVELKCVKRYELRHSASSDAELAVVLDVTVNRSVSESERL